MRLTTLFNSYHWYAPRYLFSFLLTAMLSMNFFKIMLLELRNLPTVSQSRVPQQNTVLLTQSWSSGVFPILTGSWQAICIITTERSMLRSRAFYTANTPGCTLKVSIHGRHGHHAAFGLTISLAVNSISPKIILFHCILHQIKPTGLVSAAHLHLQWKQLAIIYIPRFKMPPTCLNTHLSKMIWRNIKIHLQQRLHSHGWKIKSN